MPLARSGAGPGPPRELLSDDLERWLADDGDKTVGSLVGLFGQRSFAILFVLLLAVPALPLPTGGATHVFELIAMLLALQLIVGRDRIWLPRRWCALSLAGPKQQRFIGALMRMVRRLERVSRRRLGFLFGHRLSQIAFGVLVLLARSARSWLRRSRASTPCRRWASYCCHSACCSRTSRSSSSGSRWASGECCSRSCWEKPQSTG